MNKNLFILLCCMLALFIGCTAMPNDDTIYLSGQYVIVDENGCSVPFEHKIKCNMEVTYNSQLSYGQSTYKKTIPFYSEEDGSFEFEVNNVGSYIIKLSSLYIDGDTLTYSGDTTIRCTNGKPQTNVILPLKYQHSFNTTLTPSYILPKDTITISINHDALTLVEIGQPVFGNDNNYLIRDDGLLELNVLWNYIVANEQKFSFTLENSESIIPEQSPSVHLYIRYTTINYGAYQMAFYLYRQ